MPHVRLSKRGAQRRHPWIYRSDIAELDPSIKGGDLVEVRDPGGRRLAVAAYSDASTIAIRKTPIALGSDFDASWLELVDAAVARRAGRPPVGRLVHGDADGLPGLIVDRYGDAISFQTLTQTAARLEAVSVERIRAQTGARLVVARNDVKVRAYEQLPVEKGIRYGEPPTSVEVEIAGLTRTVDLLLGQKTGAFLDQLENQECLAALATPGEALDCFCNEAGFALQLARAGSRVIGIDTSAEALARGTQAAHRNGLEGRVELLRKNVFDELRVYEADLRRFDTLILDPPAFAKSRNALPAARRAYKEINLRALKLLRPGGLLVTCSCSANLDRATFDATVAEAASDAGRWVRIIHRGGPPADHPVLLTAPETDYLKVLFCKVG